MLEDGGDGPERLVGRHRTLAQHHGLGPGEVDHRRRRARKRPASTTRRPQRGSPPAPRRAAAGPARPGRFALVAARRRHVSSSARASPSTVGTRTPIVSGRGAGQPAVTPRRDSARRACTARAGAPARSRRRGRAARAGTRAAGRGRRRRAPSAAGRLGPSPGRAPDRLFRVRSRRQAVDGVGRDDARAARRGSPRRRRRRQTRRALHDPVAAGQVRRGRNVGVPDARRAAAAVSLPARRRPRARASRPGAARRAPPARPPR